MSTHNPSIPGPSAPWKRISLRRLAILLLVVSCLLLVRKFSTPLQRSVHRYTTVRPPVAATPPVLPNYRAPFNSCRALFRNDEAAKAAALETQKNYKGHIASDASFSQLSCREFLAQRRYITNVMSEEERLFPIAFTLVVFKELGQVERLFRAIYRPQNVYCFHVDSKAPEEFRKGVARITSCFPNAFMSERTVDVRWGFWSVLEADLICMRELLRRHKTWRYLINLTGQEFPLRTNLELVRLLKALNGSNAMEGTVKGLNPGRAPTVSPLKITWTKGSLHIVAKRAFFEFLFSNPTALQITKLLQPMPFADETLFATLNHNPKLGTPGAYLGVPETGPNYPFLPRYKNWGNFPCHSGRWVRSICIWGSSDLGHINTRPELFLNKLYWNFQPLTLDCLEERIFNHTRRDYGDRSATNDPELDLKFYRQLSFVKNHQ